MKVTLFTPSFRGDHDLCVALCESVDAYNADALEHVLAVPRRDLALFRPLAGPRRTVIAQEEVLPPSLRQLPCPPRVRVPGLPPKQLRTLWLTGSLRPVRGWLLQQVVKLSANRACDADAFVFVDSDVTFVRAFGRRHFLRGGDVLLHYEPSCMATSHEDQVRWHRAACRLLGLEAGDYAGDNYIAPVLCWRADRLAELQRRVREVAGRDDREALLACRDLSEYVLYGLFCDTVLDRRDGHQRTARKFCLEDWNFDLGRPDQLAAFMDGLQPHHIGVLMQSTNGWPMEERRAMLRTITAKEPSGA